MQTPKTQSIKRSNTVFLCFNYLAPTRYEYSVIYSFSFLQDLSKIPKPTVLTLDPNDENIILSIPDDRDPEDIEEEQAAGTTKEKKVHVHQVQSLQKLLGALTSCSQCFGCPIGLNNILLD